MVEKRVRDVRSGLMPGLVCEKAQPGEQIHAWKDTKQDGPAAERGIHVWHDAQVRRPGTEYKVVLPGLASQPGFWKGWHGGFCQHGHRLLHGTAISPIAITMYHLS